MLLFVCVNSCELSPIFLFLVGFVLVLAIIYVLTQRKRKKEKGTLWAPEGFPLNKKQRKEPIGQDDYHLKVRFFILFRPFLLWFIFNQEICYNSKFCLNLVAKLDRLAKHTLVME